MTNGVKREAVRQRLNDDKAMFFCSVLVILGLLILTGVVT